MANAEAQNLALSWGVTTAEATQPTSQVLVEPNSVSLSPNISSTQSAAIRAGRTPPDQIRTDADGQGDVVLEMADRHLEEILQVTMANDYTAVADIAVANCDISTAGVLDPSPGTEFTTAGVAVGDIFYLESLSSTTNNGSVIVTAVSGETITVSKLNGKDFALETDSTGITLRRDNTISIGALSKWLWIQKGFGDGGAGYISTEMYKAARCGTMDVTWTPGSITNITFGIQSAVPVRAAATQWSAPSFVNGGLAWGKKPLNGLDNVRAIVEDILGTPNELGAVVTELNVNLNNNVQSDSVVSRFGSIGTRLGQAQLTGRLNAFLYTNALMDKLDQEVETSLAFCMDDGVGGGFGFLLSGVRFTGVSTPVTGANDLVLQQLEWNATGLTVTLFNGA